MPADIRLKTRSSLSGAPALAAAEPGFASAQPALVIGSAGGNRLMAVLCKNDATGAPTVNDDAADGFSVGSTWDDVTNDKSYRCLDATTGAAVWQQTSGAGTGGGVTSVGLTMPGVFSVTGSPVTGAGTLAVSFNSASANQFLAGPNGGGPAPPNYRALVAADLGTGTANSTKFLRGDMTWQNTPAGTVSSVGLSMPSIFNVTGSPVTGSGTLSATLAAATANNVFAGPTSGSPSSPNFRTLVPADLGTGSPSGSNFLRGDGVWAAPTGANVVVAPGGRLTATSGNAGGPDVSSPSTVYYTPYHHDQITLWNGSAWATVTFTEQTMALSGLSPGAVYDVFGYLSGGALAIERLVWSTTVSRATAITLQDGRYCRSGDKTRLYLGTFYAISSSITSDSPGFRCIWNMYNRLTKSLKVTEATDSWTYSTAAWRPANNNSGNRVMLVRGLDDDAVSVTVTGLIGTSPGNSGSVGVGMDNTAAFSGVPGYVNASGAINTYANYTGPTGIGLRALWWLEYSQIGSPTFYGDGGAPTFVQCGLTGTTQT